MTSEDYNSIKSFLLKECETSINPVDPTDTRTFAEIKELVDVFMLVLKYQSSTNELEEVGNKVVNAIAIYASNNMSVDKLFNGLEAISTGFESFLKKIAELKYSSDSLEFRGDGSNYLGYINTTLGKLLEGQVAKANTNAVVPKLPRPIVTFSYNSPLLTDRIYDYVRNLRNEVHVARSKTILEYLTSFKICISAYLLAVEENISVIRPYVDPIFVYLKSTKKKFQALNDLFVDIESEGTRDLTIDIPDLEAVQFIVEENKESVTVENLIKEPITKLLQSQRRLWLIGEPGSGKTTSLQISALRQSEKLLRIGYIQDNSIPIYVPLKLISEGKTLTKYVRDSLKFNEEALDRFLIQKKVRLILDGMNEISDALQVKIQNEITALINAYENLEINISSRRYGFTKGLQFPTFELLPLSLQQIEEYVKKYVRSSANAENLLTQLRESNELILDFARNPLLLNMLIQVGVKEQIQSNFGLLFQKFVNWIFEREKKKASQLDVKLKEKILAELAFAMRIKLVRTIEYDTAVTIIETAIEKSREDIGAISFLNEVLDNRILVRDSEKQIGFFHELVLEYYTALKLLGIYSYEQSSALKFVTQPIWQESFIILSGIIKNPDNLVVRISQNNLILAARCISSGSKVSDSAIQVVFKESERQLLNEPAHESEAITALLELANSDSFRLVVKHLAMREHSFTKALSKCQRPELIALKLLKFGLTGKNRIRQCLKVFVNRPNSRSFIDSETIGNAQLILISGKIEVEDVSLIQSLGISIKSVDRIKTRISAIIHNGDINSSIYAKTCELIGQHAVLEDLKGQIFERSKDHFAKYKEGNQLYHALRVLKVVKRFSPVDELVSILLERIIVMKYFGLLKVYLLSFNVDTERYLERVLPSIISSGRPNVILEYRSAFPDIITKENLIDTLRARIEIGFIPETFALVREVRDIMTAMDIKHFVHSIIYNPATKNISTSKITYWVNQLRLTEEFKNLAIVTSVNREKRFGFARNLVDGEMYYFNYRTHSKAAIISPKRFINVQRVLEVSDQKTSFEGQNGIKYRKPKIGVFDLLGT